MMTCTLHSYYELATSEHDLTRYPSVHSAMKLYSLGLCPYSAANNRPRPQQCPM